MTSHLPSAVSDLLEAGLSSLELASMMGIAHGEVEAILKAEEPSGLTYGGAIRLGKLTYLLWELRRTLTEQTRRSVSSWIEAKQLGPRRLAVRQP